MDGRMNERRILKINGRMNERMILKIDARMLPLVSWRSVMMWLLKKSLTLMSSVV